ncbi:MAG: DUF2218 domain-containing protein [Pararhodobacter sp.]
MTTPRPATEHGTFQTANASRYLQQLCKHFGHKLPVAFDETQGTITFPMGTARLAATPEALVVDFTVDDPEARERARHVIDKHLQRFAFREGFEAMTWAAPAAQGPL